MKTKKLVPIAFVVLLVLAWYSSCSKIIGAPIDYNRHLKAAKKYEKEERYQYAIEEYDAALEYKPENFELYYKKMENYEKLNDTSSMISVCTYIIENFEKSENAYLKQLEYYIGEADYETAASIAKTAVVKHPESKKIKEYYKQLRGLYSEIYAAYSQMSAIRNNSIIVENEDGKKGLINGEGKVIVKLNYENISMYSNVEDSKENLSAVQKDGEWYYMDEKGYKALVNEEKYDFLGEISQGIMAVGKKGKYGFAVWDMENRSFSAATKMKWDYVGTFLNGVAAVCKDDKWALINTKFEEITKYKYDEIIVDEFDLCSRYKVVFVREGDKYKLINLEGEDITKAEFDFVKPFSNGELAAVCKDGKWGFINTEGELKIKYKYEDAKSFSDLYAPVMKDGLWGYINKKEEVTVDYQFEDAKQFSTLGIAPVYSNERWQLIKLYIYE